MRHSRPQSSISLMFFGFQGNVSQVDRLWTFLPVAYSVHFTFFPKWSGTGELEPRMLLLLGLQLLWAARLTRNTYIRGFFNPSAPSPFHQLSTSRIPPSFGQISPTFLANPPLSLPDLPRTTAGSTRSKK